jgi:hypothetical protein
LNLALLIHAQNQRLVGRIEVKADDVAHLFDEERIGREFERLAAVRLQPKQVEKAVDAAFRDAGLRRDAPDVT